MSIIGLAIIAIVVLVLLSIGLIAGFVIGTNDEHIDVLAKRLAAEQRMEQVTRDTLHAMRGALRNRGA